MADPLFNVRNLFYLGAFQSAINEAQDLTALSEQDRVDRDVFVYRSYIALGSSQLVLSEVTDASALALQAVKLQAEYTSNAISKDDLLSKLQGWLDDPVSSHNKTVCVIAGIIYGKERNQVEALKACHSGGSLEMQAVMVQSYLAMSRADQAEKVVKAMSAVDDDATLTQLATAWTGLALGGGKVQEAAYIYQELGDKYTWTASLHSGLAAANMKMGRWDEAETELQDALRKNDKDADTLANLVACSLHLGKPYSRYLTQLKMQAPDHAFVSSWSAAETEFDRAALAAA